MKAIFLIPVGFASRWMTLWMNVFVALIRDGMTVGDIRFAPAGDVPPLVGSSFGRGGMQGSGAQQRRRTLRSGRA